MPVWTPTPGWSPQQPPLPVPSSLNNPYAAPYPYPHPYPPRSQRSSGAVIAAVATSLVLGLSGVGVAVWMMNDGGTAPKAPTHTDAPTRTAGPSVEGPWGLPTLPTAPAAPVNPAPANTAALVNPTAPVTVGEPRIVGEMRSAPVRDALERARPAMDACRRPGRVERVSVLAIVSDDGTIPIVRPADDNTGDTEVANCVAGRFRDQAPIRTPGGSGIVTFTVTLAAR